MIIQNINGKEINLYNILVVFLMAVFILCLLYLNCSLTSIQAVEQEGYEDRVLILKKPRMSGEDIYWLKVRLSELSYYRGLLDNTYDLDTARAVAAFQADNHLEIDGVVNNYVWERLLDAAAESLLSTTDVEEGPEGEISIVIDTYKRQLTLFSDDKPYKNYPIAIGKPTTKSPVGEWAIINKNLHWGGGFGTRWLGLNVPWGTYGIHGTNKPWTIGSAASHGCIRMFNHHVEELYRWVPLKTRVKIIGHRVPINVNTILRPGQSGLSVMQLQDNLNKQGFNSGYRDARYGSTTEEAVKELKAQFGLKADGIADWNVLYLLGLPEN